ncbi:hypothetical protein PTTG_29595, partial [Puccinia triticina 1-1 BBBD Race 1]
GEKSLHQTFPLFMPLTGYFNPLRPHSRSPHQQPTRLGTVNYLPRDPHCCPRPVQHTRSTAPPPRRCLIVITVISTRQVARPLARLHLPYKSNQANRNHSRST